MGVEVVTFGCRLNLVESEAMRRHAEAAGHDNLVIINTCAVTAEAGRQARQAIRRLKRQRPAATVVVTGCGAQVEPQRFAAMAEVAQVVGNAEKVEAATWSRDAFAPFSDPGAGFARVKVADIMTVRQTAPHLADGFAGRTRAFVEVQNGCDHRCTFCIIPYGRGPARSAPAGAVVEHVARLAESGVGEVVLTGVDVTSWGTDLPGAPRLGTLVKAVLRHVPSLPRLRLSSLDPVELDPDLLDALASEPRLMPHLHLSVQAGDDMVLTRMKRRHRRADVEAICAQARRLRPDVVFGADLIAGFPTETEAMFEASLALVEACGLTHLHVFPYSPRPGTPAARMPQVAPAEVKERAARLRQAGEAALVGHLDALVGTEQRVLAEIGGTGRTESFAAVATPDLPAGTIAAVRMAGHDGRVLRTA